jgi:hypothetical protein
MVALPQTLAASKVGDAVSRAVLFEHRVDVAYAQDAQQKIGGVERITHQHAPAPERIENRAK